jgi:hypothetical protein
MADEREHLGRLVRDTWDATVHEVADDPAPSRVAPWDELDGGQRKAALRIGEAVAAAERERIRQLAISTGAVCTGDEGTSCYFADLLGDGERRVVMAPGIPDLVAVDGGPLLDPSCRNGQHVLCLGAPCECPVPGVHSARHDHERSQP